MYDDPFTMFDARYHGRNKWLGAKLGIVTQPPSQDPILHDRIRCWFENLPGGQQGDYTRMLSLGQGYKCGLFLPPHVDDEVVLFSRSGDPHNLYYLTHSSERKPPPDEHLAGKPEERWMLRTLRGHIQEWFDEEGFQHIRLQSADGHEILLDDVPGQVKIKITDQEGRYTVWDCENKKIETQDLSGNLFRLRDGAVKDILIAHGVSESFLWFKENGDVHLNAQEALRLTCKQLIEWPTEDWTKRIPATTHTCIDEGTDYYNCPVPVREAKCFDCETGETTGGNPPSPNEPQAINGGNF